MDFYADCGIPFTYTVELPDFGTKGFLLPASEIHSVNEGWIFNPIFNPIF